MPITHAESETQHVIRLEGDVDVACAADLKRMLIEAVSSRKKLQVDMAAATDLDITAMQLLWAAKLEAERAGASCMFGPVPGGIVTVLEEAGFGNFLVPGIPEGVLGDCEAGADSEHR